MTSPDHVETPERVTIELDLAGIGSRAVAQLVDIAAMGVVWLVFTLPLGLIADGLGVWAFVLWFAMTFVLSWSYHTVFEAVWGQTPGKRLMGLRVQRLGGYPVGWPEALLRNLLRPVDFLGFYGVGVVSMLVTARHQRIGDLVAGTVVVREGERLTDELERLGYAAERGSAASSSWLSTREYELLHDYFARRDELDPAAASRVGAALAQHFRNDLARRGHSGWHHLSDEELLAQLRQTSGAARPQESV